MEISFAWMNAGYTCPAVELMVQHYHQTRMEQDKFQCRGRTASILEANEQERTTTVDHVSTLVPEDRSSKTYTIEQT